MHTEVTRCINIDWLEVHCLEPFDVPRDPQFFLNQGWQVSVRPYGTRFYTQMFTLLFPDGERFLEIRRAPSSGNSQSAAQYFEPNSVSIRLCNRTCYFKGAAKILDEFIVQQGFEFRRISRIDIALDFEKFDSGDDPQKFLHRYLNGAYSKINQGNIRANGKDLWDGRFWNSLAWGSPKSQIGTKFYCKTLEIREAKDKPYIRQVWASAGLVDDFIQLTKKGKDGAYYKPDIWRVEFSIMSSVKRWFVMEHDELGNPKKQSVPNILSYYYSDTQLLNVFASLASHYFHFKHFEAGQRKDRCKDKVLFNFTSQDQFFKVEKLATERPADIQLIRLKARLELYKQTHFDAEVRKAVDILVHTLNEELLKKSAVRPYDQDEVGILRQLIALRISNHCANPLEVDKETAQQLWQIERDLWSNNKDRIPI